MGVRRTCLPLSEGDCQLSLIGRCMKILRACWSKWARREIMERRRRVLGELACGGNSEHFMYSYLMQESRMGKLP